MRKMFTAIKTIFFSFICRHEMPATGVKWEIELLWNVNRSEWEGECYF